MTSTVNFGNPVVPDGASMYVVTLFSLLDGKWRTNKLCTSVVIKTPEQMKAYVSLKKHELKTADTTCGGLFAPTRTKQKLRIRKVVVESTETFNLN